MTHFPISEIIAPQKVQRSVVARIAMNKAEIDAAWSWWFSIDFMKRMEVAKWHSDYSVYGIWILRGRPKPLVWNGAFIPYIQKDISKYPDHRDQFYSRPQGCVHYRTLN